MLGEVHVLPGGYDLADHRAVGGHALAAMDRRPDVPVPELDVAAVYDHGHRLGVARRDVRAPVIVA